MIVWKAASLKNFRPLKNFLQPEIHPENARKEFSMAVIYKLYSVLLKGRLIAACRDVD